MRLAALAGVLVLAIGCVIWATARRSHPVVPLAVVESPPVPSELPALSDPGAETATRSVADPASALRTQVYVPDGPKVRIHGTVVVTDEAGREHAPQTGSFKLWLNKDRRPWFADAQVANGRWSADVVAAEEFALHSATLDGRVAYVVDLVGQHPFPELREQNLRFQWPRVLVLHARDAATGADLKNIEVLPHSPWLGELEPELIGKSGMRGDSPLALRLEDSERLVTASSVFVRDGTHAWTAVRVDPKRGGDVFAELPLACGLTVLIEGDRTVADVRIHASSQDRSNYAFDIALGSKQSITEGFLAPGLYEVLAYKFSHEDTVFYARQAVTLAAGATAVARLSLVLPPAVPTRDYSGVFVVPIEWDVFEHNLWVEFVEEVAGGQRSSMRALVLEPPTERPGFREYKWRLERARAGKYVFRLHTFTWSVELEPDTDTEIRLELPPPASVSFRVVDEGTRQDVVVDNVSWHTVRKGRDDGGSPATVKRDAATGRYEAKCPIGDIEARLYGVPLGYTSVEKRATLVPGQNEVVLELRKATCLRFSVKDGSLELPPQERLQFEVVETAKPSAVNRNVLSWSEKGVTLSKPGIYHVAIKTPLAGFVTPAPVVVEAKAGEVTDVVIQLTRKP